MENLFCDTSPFWFWMVVAYGVYQIYRHRYQIFDVKVKRDDKH